VGQGHRSGRGGLQNKGGSKEGFYRVLWREDDRASLIWVQTERPSKLIIGKFKHTHLIEGHALKKKAGA